MNKINQLWTKHHKLYLSWIRRPDIYQLQVVGRLPEHLRSNLSAKENELRRNVREFRQAYYKYAIR